MNKKNFLLFYIFVIIFVQIGVSEIVRDSDNLFSFKIPSNFRKLDVKDSFKYNFVNLNDKSINIGIDIIKDINLSFDTYVYTYLSNINKDSGVYILSRKDINIDGKKAKYFVVQSLDAKNKGILVFIKNSDKSIIFIASTSLKNNFKVLKKAISFMIDSIKFLKDNSKSNNKDKNQFVCRYFSFILPYGWNLIKKENNKFIFYNESKIDDDVSLSILVKKTIKDEDFDNFCKNYLNLLKQKLKIKVLNTSKVEIDRKLAYRVEFYNFNLEYRGILYILNSKNYSYIMIFMAKKYNFDNYIPEFKKIVKSIKFRL